MTQQLCVGPIVLQTLPAGKEVWRQPLENSVERTFAENVVHFHRSKWIRLALFGPVFGKDHMVGIQRGQHDQKPLEIWKPVAVDHDQLLVLAVLPGDDAVGFLDKGAWESVRERLAG